MALIAVDWGTTSCRLSLLNKDGNSLATFTDTHGGILSVNQLAEKKKKSNSTSSTNNPNILQLTFEERLEENIEKLSHLALFPPSSPSTSTSFSPPLDLPVLMCGMVGSRQGWYEVNYVTTPTSLQSLSKNIYRFETIKKKRKVGIIPGILHRAKSIGDSKDDIPVLGWDVMRGEETQLMGLLDQLTISTRQVVVLPGTHSKWVIMEGSTILDFQTFMTGEVYHLLSTQSILSKLMPSSSTPTTSSTDNDSLEKAFKFGLECSEGPGGLLRQIFTVRLHGLLEHLESSQLPSYLSGILIGNEIRAALDQHSFRSLTRKKTNSFNWIFFPFKALSTSIDLFSM